MNIQWKNLDNAEAFKKLLTLKGQVSLKKILSAERIKSYSIPMPGNLTYNYAAKQVNTQILSILQELADEMQVTEKFQSLYEGEIINTGEKRMVLHHMLRGQLGKKVDYTDSTGTKNALDFYQKQLSAIQTFTEQVHSGKISNESGEKFTTVVQIGIGGSDLGPRALYLALEEWAKRKECQKMTARFISNVDPDDAVSICTSIDLSKTLFILVSKSGTTQETLTNELFVKKFLSDKGLNPSKHMIAVTSETSPLANNPDYLTSFYIDDYIGGRYSSSSAVGGAVLSLAYGFETFKKFLNGAHEADKTAKNKNILENASLLDALIGVYERNVQNYSATAILPYSQALSRFPAHLQQADMESNGKHVNRNGESITYKTGPLIFGEPGTNGQHSFYQLLHQGTDVIPLQFIGYLESQRKIDIEVDKSTNQQKLCANLIAQIVAFARGQDNENPNKVFEGERPSSLIYGKHVCPTGLGALLAHFENKIMFQGFLWNINSFDQEGVQLGKLLTKQVLANDMDSVLKSYSELLEIMP